MREREPSQLNDSLLTMREAADFLHAHPNSIRRWADDGLLKSYRMGVRGDRRFSHQELLEFLESWASRQPTRV